MIIYRRPVSFQAHVSLAEMYKKQGRFEEAMKDFEEAVDLAPADPEPYYELGKLSFLIGDKEKAVFYFDKYLYLGGKEEAKVKNILKSLREK
jgi:Flp pilus assembly protein TadD